MFSFTYVYLIIKKVESLLGVRIMCGKGFFIATYFLSDFISSLEEFLKDESCWVTQEKISHCITLKEKIEVFCKASCQELKRKYQIHIEDEICKNICDIVEEILKKDLEKKDIHHILDKIERNLILHLEGYVSKTLVK